MLPRVSNFHKNRCYQFGILCFASLVLAGQVPASADDRPNIVFLMSDDQCTYSLGCYGTPGAKTPNLDQLAADGMVFDRHYDTTAICMASRATVMTGLFEYRTGCNFDHGPLLESHWQKSYPIQLRKAGYFTGFAGKFGFTVAKQPKSKGRLPEKDFDVWGGGPGQTHYQTAKNPSMADYADRYPHSTRAYGAFGQDFIKSAAQRNQPFCLSISFKAPHHPVTPDPKFDDVYRDQAFQKPKNYGREHGLHFSRQSRAGRQYARFHDWKYSTDYDGVMAKYYQQIYAIDVAVGMIREALSETKTAENTVIIYTSDNGFLCGSHGYGSKVLPYEESSRVPLMIYDPRHANSGKKLRCGALTGNCDLAPTILSLAGLKPDEDIDGKNLMRLYEDPNQLIHEYLPLINVWGPAKVHSLGVVTRDWKYLYWPYAGGDYQATEELYHIATDPLELVNRIDTAESSQVDGMRSLYDQQLAHWKQRAVPYHNYQPFGTMFDRHLSWRDKQAKLSRK